MSKQANRRSALSAGVQSVGKAQDSAEMRLSVAIAGSMERITGLGPEAMAFVFFRDSFCRDWSVDDVSHDRPTREWVAEQVICSAMLLPGVVDPAAGKLRKPVLVATVPIRGGWLSVMYGYPRPGQFATFFSSDKDLGEAEAARLRRRG